jgi:uncharacterized protein YlxW (UPF0749 family)
MVSLSIIHTIRKERDLVMNGKNKLILSLTFISVILGGMVSMQYKSLHNADQDSLLNQTDNNTKQLMAQLKALQDYNAKQEQKLNSLNKQLTEYQKVTGEQSGEGQSIQDELNRAKILSGDVPVHGPGINVVINDNQKTPAKGDNPELSLTHDWDIRLVINELFTAGAEAVSVNGVRIVSTSGVFCIGPVVKINDIRLSPPFEIDAIGDPHTLSQALNVHGGVLDYLRSYSLDVTDPKQIKDIQIPAYTAGHTDNSVLNYGP